MSFELFPVLQWLDNNGSPLAGGLISTFIAGTNTPQATYTDSTGTVPQANPVVLDSAGRAQIWFAPASYKLVLKTASGVTLMTIDNVTLDNLAAAISSLSMTGALTMQQPTAATAGANQSSNTYSLQGTYWNGAASATDTWQFQNVIGAGANPTSTLKITHSGSSGLASVDFPSGAVFPNPSFTGTVTSSNFNAILWVDGVHYTTVMAAYADLPATGGCVMVPPNYSETVGADWTLSKAYSAIVFTGPASMNFGAHVITVPVGVHGVTVESWVPWGSVVISDPSGVEFKYTGTGTFWTVGASTADTFSFRAKDICIFTNNAGSAAIGIDLIRCPIYELRSLRFIGPGGAVTQQAVILDGTGNFTGGIIYFPWIVGYLKGIQGTGSGVNAANANEIFGGSISSPASGASLGIDFQAGSSGNVVYGTDVEAHSIGYNLAGTAQGNIIFGRSETNTSGCTLGASTLQNEIHLIGADPVTNNAPITAGNLIYTSGGTTSGATMTQASSQNNVTLLNSQDVVGPLTGNSADQTIFTYTLPGKTMAAGKGIRVKVWWVHGTGTASVTYKLSFGATAVVNSASAVTGNGYAEAIIMNQPGVTTDQRASSQFSPTGTAAVINAGLHPVESTAGNVVVKFTFNVANTDQVTGAQWVVELIQ